MIFLKIFQSTYSHIFERHPFQGDKRAEETGVKGFAGRPPRSRLPLPALQAAWRPPGDHRGDHLGEDAGQELADLRL